LKTLEKINRKGIRNSRKIGKANSAQGSPLSPDRARAPAPVRPLCLTGGPRLLAQTRALTLPRSLAAQWTQPVGASYFTNSLSLSLCLAGPVRQPPSRCPACPLFSLCAVSLPCQFRLPPCSPWTGVCALAHVAGFLGHDARPCTQLPFLEPRQCPALAPRLISHTLALSRALPSPPDAAEDPRPCS
jgi:hypothetical protein